MTIQELLKNKSIRKLKPQTLKAYLFLLEKLDNSLVIKKFSIRKQALEWGSDPTLNLSGNKDTVSAIIKELENADLVVANFEAKTLEFKKQQ